MIGLSRGALSGSFSQLSPLSVALLLVWPCPTIGGAKITCANIKLARFNAIEDYPDF